MNKTEPVLSNLSSAQLADDADALPPFIVGDVGGTHARFGIANPAKREIECQDVFPTDSFADLGEALLAFQEKVGRTDLECATIAIAYPVLGDAVAMTNGRWRFSISEVRHRLGLRSLDLINDLSAQALALPLLPRSSFTKIGGGEVVLSAAIAVVGAGTGLGVSGLIPNLAGSGWAVIKGEGGHASLAAENGLEAQIVAAIWQKFGHASAERILSGAGLVFLYGCLASHEGIEVESLDPAEICHRATLDLASGANSICRKTTDAFFGFLGAVAGDLALTLGARGGVCVTGGVSEQNLQLLEASPFRARFEAKGRFTEYLSRIPTYLVNDQLSTLVGAARAGGMRSTGNHGVWPLA